MGGQLPRTVLAITGMENEQGHSTTAGESARHCLADTKHSRGGSRRVATRRRANLDGTMIPHRLINVEAQGVRDTAFSNVFFWIIVNSVVFKAKGGA